ncbi:MAG: hypothetical protein GEU82_06635 [Luteitalea sp.]|nr:hypothetical protein [Luteitalea sp.]
MRPFVLNVVLSLLALVPGAAVAQVYQTATPPPQVTSASAGWQVAGGPIFHAGAFYFPAGATVFFDGNVMKRTGVYLGVPLYQDATVEPDSIVYVPIGRNLMRPYERRREGDLAGTVGSRTPSFPVQRDMELSASLTRLYRAPVMAGPAPIDLAETAAGLRRNPAALGAPVCCFDMGTPSPATPAPATYLPTVMQSIPGPSGADGVWIVFDGSRWYLDGRAASYDVVRFAPTGNYRGFPVYREDASTERIHVTVVADGPVAPFVRR